MHAHLEWSRAQVRLEEGRIEKSKAQLAVAERHVDLANAKVELAKAKAVADLKRSDYDSIVVSDFERYVADEELDVKLAEIDAEACDKKIELRQDYLDERAKAVPASYREDWHKNEAPAAAPKK